MHIISAHPEAIKRRHEAEMRQWEREEERRKEREAEAKGLSWFEGECPENFLLLQSREELEAVAEEAQSSRKLLVVNFFTAECYVCKSLYPKLKKIAVENKDVIFVKLNGSTDNLRPFFEEVGITRVPFFKLIRDNRVVSAFTASLLPEKLAQLRGEITMHKRQTSAAAAVAAAAVDAVSAAAAATVQRPAPAMAAA